MNWKTFVSWIPGIPIAIFNGILRESWYTQFLNELHAHQLSALSFMLLFGIYVWLILDWLKLSSSKEALLLGLLWVVLTVAFEFLFGHFVMGNEWSTLLHDYNLIAGRVWVMVLVWIAIAPIMIFGLKGK